MKIVYTEDKFWAEHSQFVARLEAKISRAFKKAKRILETLPDDVTIVLQANEYDTIPETGDGGWAKNSRLILLTIDPGLPFGEEKILQGISNTVLHELNHAARFETGIFHTEFIDMAIFEGIATVFEREYGLIKPLWGEYEPNEVKQWLDEITEAGEVNHYEYMFRHSDGRRWIGYKVGTYIVDTVLSEGSVNIKQLTTMELEKIKSLAGI